MTPDDFTPGVVHSLSPLVRRVVAPNPGLMTGPGTNSYLIGNSELALIDPGPLLGDHVDALLAAAGDRLRYIFTTHTHRDHSPAWLPIKEATGATVIGAPPWDDHVQDETFVPDYIPAHNELFRTPEFSIRAVHTPGHVGNHFCFLLEDEATLFAGDHIMNGSTVVIIPPSGNMKAYLDSLALLKNYALQRIAPGHGSPIEQPYEAIDSLIQHRLGREKKVLDAVAQLGQADVDALVKVAYLDVGEHLHRVAKLSLTAHLIKLEQEGRVRAEQGQDALSLESWCHVEVVISS